jgi:hypothetical protein
MGGDAGRHLSADLLVEFTKAPMPRTGAVMADTDEVSVALRANGAKQAVSDGDAEADSPEPRLLGRNTPTEEFGPVH